MKGFRCAFHDWWCVWTANGEMSVGAVFHPKALGWGWGGQRELCSAANLNWTLLWDLFPLRQGQKPVSFHVFSCAQGIQERGGATQGAARIGGSWECVGAEGSVWALRALRGAPTRWELATLGVNRERRRPGKGCRIVFLGKLSITMYYSYSLRLEKICILSVK